MNKAVQKSWPFFKVVACYHLAYLKNVQPEPSFTLLSCQPAQYYSHDIYSVGLVMWELFSWVRCKQNILNKLAGERRENKCYYLRTWQVK